MYTEEQISEKINEVKTKVFEGKVRQAEIRAKARNKEPEVIAIPVYDIIEEARFRRLAIRELNKIN